MTRSLSFSVLGLSAVVFVAILSPLATATPPCAPLGYFSAYDRSTWSITLMTYSPYLSLETSFYSLHQTYDPLSPFEGPYHSIAPTVNRQPTVEEPFSYQDYDSDWNISSGDEVLIYDPPGMYRYFLIGWGKNETSIGGSQGFQLRDNQWVSCRTVIMPTAPSPSQLLAPTILLVLLAVLTSRLLSRLITGQVHPKLLAEQDGKSCHESAMKRSLRSHKGLMVRH